MRDRLIPDPVRARREYAWWTNECALLRRCRIGCSTCTRIALRTDAASLALDAATALWIAGDQPRGIAYG